MLRSGFGCLGVGLFYQGGVLRLTHVSLQREDIDLERCHFFVGMLVVRLLQLLG